MEDVKDTAQETTPQVSDQGDGATGAAPTTEPAAEAGAAEEQKASE